MVDIVLDVKRVARCTLRTLITRDCQIRNRSFRIIQIGAVDLIIFNIIRMIYILH